MADDTDERWCWDADFCKDILRVLDLDLVDAQHGRELFAHIRYLHPYRGIDRNVCLPSMKAYLC